MTAIGIDLGTTNSCVGVWKQDRVKIIANEYDNRKTPSCVAFTDTGHLIGEAAKIQGIINPESTIFATKKLIGCNPKDPVIQQHLKSSPYKVVNDQKKLKIEVCLKGERKRFAPEEISSMVLAEMKKIATDYLGQTVKDAVITVPAKYNYLQRQAVRNAAAEAGINVIRFISEPTAACLSYGFTKLMQRRGERNVLVIVLGSGTCGVCVVTIEDSIFEVLATAGNNHLGGEDFDFRLVRYLCTEFKRRFKKEISNDAKAIQRLRAAAERAKHILSSKAEANIEIDALHDGIDFCTKVSRAEFDNFCADYFTDILGLLSEALTATPFGKDRIDDIVLVGRSTRIPKIKALIQNYFNRPVNFSDEVNETVVSGAVLQAAILSGSTNSKSLEDILLLDVLPISMGVEIDGGNMVTMVKSNTMIPMKSSQMFTTTRENQTCVTIQVYEGESKLSKNNQLIGIFQLCGICPSPKGIPQIEVIFDLDANGKLVVTAEHKVSGKAIDSRLMCDNIPSSEQITRMRMDNTTMTRYTNSTIKVEPKEEPHDLSDEAEMA